MPAGAPLTVDRDNDKGPVVALREIADETIPLENLQNNVIKGMQKHVEIDEPEEDHDVEIGAPASWAADMAPLGKARTKTRSRKPRSTPRLQEDMLAEPDAGVGWATVVLPDLPEGEAEPGDKIE